MSGDWIKMRHSLQKDPRVVRIMSACEADRFRTLGGLFAAWCLFDEQTEDGFLSGYSPEVFDEIIGFPGLCAAMIAVGWVEEMPEGLTAVRFDEHNGATAKRRSQDRVRKMSARQADKTRTTRGLNPDAIEKRREEKNKRSPLPPSLDTEDFRAAWDEWRRHRSEKRAKLTPTSIKRQLATLQEMGPARAAEAIRHSIANGYTGIFEPNGKPNGPPKQTPEQLAEEAERIYQERKAQHNAG